MKKITEKIKEDINKNKITYIISFLLLLVFTIIFSLDRSAPDTYSLQSYRYIFPDKLPYVDDGRFFMTIFFCSLCWVLHVPYSLFKFLSWLLAFGSLYFAIIIMYKILEKHAQKKSLILSFLLVLNIFVLEYFIFADYTGIMCLGILFASISSYFYLKFISSKRKKDFIISLISSLFIAFCYQGTFSLVVLFPILFTLKYSKKLIDFIKNTLYLVCIYAIPALFALIIGKVIGTSRLKAEISILKAIPKVFTDTKNLLGHTAGILPKYLFIILFILGFLFVIVKMIKTKKKWYEYIFLLYGILACIIVPLVPQFVIGYENIWLVPRSTIGLALLVLFPILYFYIYIGKEKYQNVLTFLLVILMVFELSGYLKYGFAQIKNNALEEQEINEIIDKIEEYQEDDKLVDKLSVYYDKNTTYVFPNISAFGDMNIRVLSHDWGIRAMLFSRIGRSLELTEDKEFKDYCQKNDWNELTDDTFKVENDTLYMCVY